MAKMFYTLEEAAEKLAKTTDEVASMGKSGQIQEFRDRDRLMFKRQQIDLLAGGGDETETAASDAGEDPGMIGLADSGEGQAVELKDESVLGLEDSRDSTGIALFDADELEASDPSAVTHVSDTAVAPMEFSLDAGSSGSGLLDLTREEDDTSLGGVLDEIYPSEDDAEMGGAGSGLFASDTDDAAGAEAEAAAAGMVMPQVVEIYDGGWSGLGVGMSIGAVISLLLAAQVLLGSHANTLDSLTSTVAGNFPIVMGGLAGGTVLLGLIGYFVGRSTG